MKQTLIVSFFLAILLIGCAKPDNDVANSQASTDIAKSSSSNQSFWLNQLGGYSAVSQPQQTKNLIDSLKYEVSRDYSQRNTRIRDIGVSLSFLLSEKDFKELFVVQNPLLPSLISINPAGCQLCASNLRNDWDELAGQSSGGDTYVIGWPDCNCSWTCGDSALSECNTSDCNGTDMGCGFLWLQSCDGFDSLHPC